MGLTAIVAMDELGGIGTTKCGHVALPWNIPEEMNHFRLMTQGKDCIMGRKTGENLKKYGLKDRHIHCITRDPSQHQDNAHITYYTFDDFMDKFKGTKELDDMMVCGGAEIYDLFAPYTKYWIVSTITGHWQCDTKINKNLYEHGCVCLHTNKINPIWKIEVFANKKMILPLTYRNLYL